MRQYFTKSYFILFFFITACGGGEHSPGGCTDAVLQELNQVTEVCALNMEVEANKKKCEQKAKSYQLKYPDVVCNLESADGEVEVDSQFIEEVFIEPADSESREEEILNSGIFDE